MGALRIVLYRKRQYAILLPGKYVECRHGRFSLRMINSRRLRTRDRIRIVSGHLKQGGAHRSAAPLRHLSFFQGGAPWPVLLQRWVPVRKITKYRAPWERGRGARCNYVQLRKTWTYITVDRRRWRLKKDHQNISLLLAVKNSMSSVTSWMLLSPLRILLVTTLTYTRIAVQNIVSTIVSLHKVLFYISCS